MLTRESLLKESELKTETIKLKSGEAIAREIGAAEYLEALHNPLAQDEKGAYCGPKFIALMVVRCLFDKKGNRLFTDEDAATLRNGSFALYQKLVKAVNRVNGLGDEVKN